MSHLRLGDCDHAHGRLQSVRGLFRKSRPLLTTSRYTELLMASSTFERMTERLVGIREIAAMLGVSPQRVDQLSNTVGFPVPEAQLASGRIWTRAAVEKWAKQTGREIVGEGK